MTRKKWNRLRRTRPELFSKLPPWEKMNDCERKLMKRVSVTQAVTRMHSLFISDYAEFEYLPPHTFTYYAFNPAANHPDQAAPLQIPGLRGNLWNWTPANLGPDPGYPPQSWPEVAQTIKQVVKAIDKLVGPAVEVTQDRFLVDGKFHVEHSALPAKPPK